MKWSPLQSIAAQLGAIGGIAVYTEAAGQPEVLARCGPIELRLANGSADVRRAQHLRYNTFYKYKQAVPNILKVVTRRDFDEFDAVCDHLLVIDHDLEAAGSRNSVVGTYRLLRQDVADRYGGFYSSHEYDVAELIKRQRTARFLEVGRACVLESHRNRRVVELLWHGICLYATHYRVDALIGCASFDETDPDKLAFPLSYLHHYASAPDEWQICAHPDRYVEMNRMPKKLIDSVAAFRQLPALIRAYLRLGAYIGRGAVIDDHFATTDVAVVLPVSTVNMRYVRHFR